MGVSRVIGERPELDDELRDHPKERIVVEQAVVHQLVQPIDAVRGPDAVCLDDEHAARRLKRDAKGIRRRSGRKGRSRCWLLFRTPDNQPDCEENPGCACPDEERFHGVIMAIGRAAARRPTVYSAYPTRFAPTITALILTPKLAQLVTSMIGKIDKTT